MNGIVNATLGGRLNNQAIAEADSPELLTATSLIWKVCPPVLLVVGTFGNVVTIAVYTRMKWGASTQPLFLTALAVADLCVLYSGLLPDVAYQVFGFDLRGAHDVSCKMLSWFMYVSAYVSSWLLVTMTTQRAIAVTFPHRVTFLCSLRMSGALIVGIVVAAGLCLSHMLYGLKVHGSTVYLDGACAASQDYKEFWGSVWPWADITLFSLGPSAILLAVNALLVRSLRQSTKRVSAMGAAIAAENRKKMASSMTVTLISISITFMVLTLPTAIANLVWFLLGDVIQHDVVLAEKMDLVWAVTNMLWYANSAANFVLYCISGSRFRAEFLKCCLRAKQRTPMSQHTVPGIVTSTVI